MNRVNPGYGSSSTYLYCAIVLSLFLVTTSGKNLFSSVTGSGTVSKEEVELKAKDINGNLVDLSKHRDKTVVVLFFNTMKTDPLTVVLEAGKKVLFVEKPGMTEDQVMNAIFENAK